MSATRRLEVVQEQRAHRVADAAPDPASVGDAALGWLETPFLLADRVIERLLPARWNPLAQTGAIANTSFLIAAATGVLLLIWYSPSVHGAFPSVVAMASAPYTAQLVRSLHRYSSDGAMLFVVLHALRLAGARRYTGPRWLAWVTGLVAIGSLWLVGWLGYWLVWDEPARQVALATAKLLDVMPIFAEPMSRAFLTDGSVHSLLFVVVFFLHMLLPLGMGIVLWLHITRLNRPRFLANARMTAAIVVALVALSLVLPAGTGRAAHMSVHPGAMRIDAFYLLPIELGDRLGGGALWALTLFATIVLGAVPWVLARGRAKPVVVDLDKCNGCTLCAADCPYGAITMVKRNDGRAFSVQAEVDAAKCVGCGICAGSCNSAAIGVPEISQVEARARMDRWIDEGIAAGAPPMFAFACAKSAASALEIDAVRGTSPALEGYRVMPVSCVGWVHALTIERALRHGAKGVLLVGCGGSEPTYREGGAHTRARLEGTRKPVLRGDRVDGSKVRLVELDRLRPGALADEAARFRRGEAGARGPARGFVRGVAAIVVAIGALLVTGLASRVTYGGPPRVGPELVVSFKHPGKASEHCRKVSDEEKAKMPPHMRRDEICERGRAAVRLRVVVDGQVRLERAYEARGLRNDGSSVALETLPVSPGSHAVEIAIGETADPNEWTWRDARTVTFEDDRRVVVLFERGDGFGWHGRDEGVDAR